MSATFRTLTEDVWVSGQIDAEDVARAAERGVTLIVNNRPDGETPGQPTSEEIAAAARAAGVAYAAVPITGRPTEAQVAAVGEALAAHDGIALLFCKSGMRSTAAWALAATATGAIDAETARTLAAGAGHDLSGLPL